jgi:hypothetical protein
VEGNILERYKHTQVGYTILIPIIIFLIFLFIISVYILNSYQWIGYLAIILIILALVFFITLTVKINGKSVQLSFGIGLVHREFAMDQVKSIKIVKYPWWYGWGVRILPGGRLYNVSGTTAVKLKMKDDKFVMIGTNEPQKLYEALNEILK